MNLIFWTKEEIGRYFLERDPLFGYLPSQDLSRFVDAAFQTGEGAAAQLTASFPGSMPSEIAKNLGITVQHMDKEDKFHYAEYIQGQNTITLYQISRETRRAYLAGSTVEQAPDIEEVLIAHELFHHLELSGMVNDRYVQQNFVVLFRLGMFEIRRVLTSMREIAATAFVKALFELP